MNNRLKVAVFALVCAGWASVIGHSLIVLKQAPDPLLWGIPAGAYTTLWPPSRKDDQAE